jgi:signal transduction histidine kinase/pSer/pThr/pTyr-binding forkhead associated (FHA) protein
MLAQPPRCEPRKPEARNFRGQDASVQQVNGVATLIVLQGPDKGRTLRTGDEVVVIGRGSPQIPLTDQTVSRRHAELKKADEGWVLTDLKSANGTYLNGARITKPTRLKHGDQVRVGSTLLVYTGEETAQQFAGTSLPRDLVTLDAGSPGTDASVVASAPAGEDSLVLAAPDTAYAVKAWNVMRELASVIGSLIPTDQLLARVLDLIFQEVDVEQGVILVSDPQTGDFLPEVVRLRSPLPVRPSNGQQIVASRTIINHVVKSREGVLCSNVVADKRFESGKSVQNLGMRSVICAPIVAREQILGIIHLDCPLTRHTYNEHELRLVTAIGYQAGLAIENARLVHSQVQRERLAAVGETIAQLSHYVKNILQGMRSGAEVVERGLDRRDLLTTAQGWRIVERNLDRSYNLMLNMLAFSKPREPRFEALQLNRIVEEVVALVQKQADAKRVMLLPDLDEHIPPIPLDYEGIYQVILNIVTNAIDAVAAEHGRINVRTHYAPDRQMAEIIVTDNGPGIPPEQREHVFEPFYSSKGHGGTGLGLAVARKIVAELGGRIDLIDPPDGGAEFRVHLPTTREAQQNAGETQGPPR